MGFRFDKKIDCNKCNTEMSHFKPAEGGYYKCTKCNNIIIKE